MKKFLTLFFIFIFCTTLSANAFSFRKKTQNPLEYTEKLEYVNLDFWKRFNDPYLTDYIATAVKNNHDARKASWLVEEYRQRVKYSFGQELPSMRVTADYAGIKIPRFDNFSLQQNAFLLPFIAQYEADFLLKNRDRTKSTKKAYESKLYEEKSVYLSLAGDVGTAYLNIMRYDSLIESQQRIVKINEEQLLQAQKKFNRGVIDNQTLSQAAQNLETAKSNLEEMLKNREQILTQFAVLIGVSPQSAKTLKRSLLKDFEYHGVLPETLSSEVIFSRPDMMAAEANLEKAKIDVRVARKEFLPTFNITGLWAFNTIAPGTFFSWESSLALILAGASQDIFKGGMKVANLKMKKAFYEEMFESYKQTSLTSLKEVNDSLIIIKADTKVDKNTLEQLNFKKHDFYDDLKKFSRGVISYPALLSGEAALLNTAQNRIQTKTTRIINYFTIYKALGGCI